MYSICFYVCICIFICICMKTVAGEACDITPFLLRSVSPSRWFNATTGHTTVASKHVMLFKTGSNSKHRVQFFSQNAKLSFKWKIALNTTNAMLQHHYEWLTLDLVLYARCSSKHRMRFQIQNVALNFQNTECSISIYPIG